MTENPLHDSAARVLEAKEHLTYCTVRIECRDRYGAISSGTGFFFRFLESGDGSVPAIVTNKHVVAGAVHARLHFHLRDTAGQAAGHMPLEIPDFEDQCISHPDPDVDLCAYPIAELLTAADREGIEYFLPMVDRAWIPTAEDRARFAAVEEILMVGYPNGIWDRINNQPIVRRGITATHASRDYNGERVFMIDAACFPGSSGSPVFWYATGPYVDGSGYLTLGPRILLLGVLYAGPQHTVEGEISVIDVPAVERFITLSRVPNNLGLVIKANRLLELEEVIAGNVA